MIQKIHPRGVIWVPNSSPQAGHLSEKNDDLAVQYENCPCIIKERSGHSRLHTNSEAATWC